MRSRREVPTSVCVEERERGGGEGREGEEGGGGGE